MTRRALHKWPAKFFPMKKKRGSKTARRKRPTSRKTQIKKQRRTPAVVRRTLSQINYDHWWRDHPCWSKKNGLCRDEQKAAVFFEAYRRCLSLQDAWLKGLSGPRAMIELGWQVFTASVLDHLPQTWIQLPLSLRKAITIQQLPEMLPPVGYSVWPSEPFFFDPQAIPPKDDFETQEEYEEHWRPEMLDQFHERCRNLAAKIITVPSVKYDDGLPFLKSMNRLDAEGFVLVAIDNKSREAFNYAIQFLERRLKGSRLYRGADLYCDRPKNTGAISAGEGLFKHKRILAEWRAIGKRVKRSKGGDVVLESNIFKFQELCKGLESCDKTGTPSGLMLRLRSGLKGLAR
jgi:hypothetical protein